jgi:hypothetical protein
MPEQEKFPLKEFGLVPHTREGEELDPSPPPAFLLLSGDI